MTNFTGINTPSFSLSVVIPKTTETVHPVEEPKDIPAPEHGSTGQIDPQVILKDKLREKEVRAAQVSPRKDLSKLFYGNMKLHSAVEDAPFVKNLRENPKGPDVLASYFRYLLNMHAGLSVIETALQKNAFKGRQELHFLRLLSSGCAKKRYRIF